MKEFKKYKSIENHYREKPIRDILHYNPVYNCSKYIATEKIHGANFQIRFIRGNDCDIVVEYGKRSGIIKSNEDFYNHQATVNKDPVQDIISKTSAQMRDGLFSNCESVILYAEFYGGNVQKGVNYGPDKDVIFFDMCVDGEYYTPEMFYAYFSAINHSDQTVPIVAEFDTLEEALAFEVEGKITQVGIDEEDNCWEGVVIKPWNVIARNKENEQVLFYIKKKCEKFKDKANAKKYRGTRADLPTDLPTELITAQEAFSQYLTEQRVLDVFSHEGEIKSQKDIGKYIKFVMEDAKEDFFKDYMDEFNAVPDKHKGKVFSITGKIVSKILFKYV